MPAAACLLAILLLAAPGCASARVRPAQPAQASGRDGAVAALAPLPARCLAALKAGASVVLCDGASARVAARALPAPGRRVAVRWARLPRPAAVAALLAVGGGRAAAARFALPASPRASSGVLSAVAGQVVLTVRGRRVPARAAASWPLPASPGPAADPGPEAGVTPPPAGAFVPPSPLQACSAFAPQAGQARPALDAAWRLPGPGWTGADGAFSAALPDGRAAWIFGDTFLGHVDPDGSRPRTTPMVRNSMVITSAGAPRTLAGGTPAAPQALAPATRAGAWLWPGDASVQDGRLLAFYSRMAATGSGTWDFASSGTDIAVFSLPDFKLERVISGPGDGRVHWGAAIVEGTPFTYVYGVQASSPKRMHLARAASGNLLGSWEFWTGSGWSAAERDSAPFGPAVSAQFSVTPAGAAGYVLVTQQDGFSRVITASAAPAPWGPFSAPAPVYTAPKPAAAQGFAYNAVAHPEASEPGSLTVSYSVNSFDPADVYSDAGAYRPRFFSFRACS